jgi:taurine dioxygenase
MEVVSQSSSIGAEIRGIDLSSGLTPAQYDELNRAFLDHQIVFFRDQYLTPQQYVDFASHFGPPREYLFADGIDGFPVITEIVKSETETESFGSFWHSD